MRERIVRLVIFGLLLTIFVPIFVMTLGGRARKGWVMPGVMSPGMMGGDGFEYGWMHGLSWPLIVAFIGLIALGAYYMVSGYRAPTTDGDRSLEILRERFAKGELTEEQFRRMRAEISR